MFPIRVQCYCHGLQCHNASAGFLLWFQTAWRQEGGLWCVVTGARPVLVDQHVCNHMDCLYESGAAEEGFHAPTVGEQWREPQVLSTESVLVLYSITSFGFFPLLDSLCMF